MRHQFLPFTAAAALVAGGLSFAPTAAFAAEACAFTDDSATHTMTLTASCTTDVSIAVPDGWTLDGAGNTVTAVDPVDGHFTGGVIEAGGATAHVRNVTVTVAGLANRCDGADDRLRGIFFHDAGGSIVDTSVLGVNQGPSGCQEGNAIEVRSEGAPLAVDITGNTVLDYQKTGIVISGPVEAAVTKNVIGASATQENLAANSVQFSSGASGTLSQNTISGNQWMGASDWAATAVLVYGAGDLVVSKNHIGGNSDIGLYLYADGLTVIGNKVLDEGDDHPLSGYDIGIGVWGSDTTLAKNHVGGFDVAYDGIDPADLDSNKIRPAA